ncbi:MAG: histidinol-phosphate transaminase [Eubacteriales bacterium]|nr:histidinol-phosphate transaminase [Bacillota bacterium]MBV1727823.1 histidinol-phosphate transaminase [Desulforudis sp.]MDP3051075.1 histidinol-phosphate transaminase [Eubacteriales bacterium]MBU4532432.1 histidinol-phosphate transaminase [Bacillota bacterium]MBU4554043.1 histidinol-phosphate transaminase [Bacillota bacterium]
MKDLARPNIHDLAVYKPGKPIEEVQRELGLGEVIKLASNENPLGPSPLALKALEAAVPEVYLYPDGSAYRLKQVLSNYYGGLDPDRILFANGSNELVQQLSLAFLEPGDEVVAPRPSFPRYEPLARMMNARTVDVPLVDYRVDLSAMRRAVTERTKLVYICNPNNPTGTIVTKAELNTFLDGLHENCLVVLDEAYFEYVDDPSYPDGLDYLLQGERRVVVLRTFSKCFGLAGLRIGYALADPEIIAFLERVREPFNVNTLAQVAAEAALQDQEHKQRVVELNRREREFLCGEFERLGIEYIKSEANFILFNAGRDEKEVFQGMLRRGVIIRGGFGYRTWLRVTIGTRDQNEKFIEALQSVLTEG